MNILTTEHAKFKEFIQALESKLGDLKKGKCNGNFTYTREILSGYNDIDSEETINYLHKLGAFCDCQIIYKRILKTT